MNIGQMAVPGAACRVAATALAVMLAASAVQAQEASLTLNVAGGQIRDAGDAVVWGPVAKKLNYSLSVLTADEPLPVIRLEAASGNITTDIWEMSQFGAEIAGREGLLEPVDKSLINLQDFQPGSVSDWCVPFFSYANVLGWNTETYKDNPPQTWADFFDVEKFPGDRAMRSLPEGHLEFALLADGVPPSEVYNVLSTPEGQERALNKIRALKPNVKIWWDSGAQQTQMMLDKEVDMTTGYNGRLQTAKSQGAPADYTFNNALLGIDCFAISKGSKNKDAAKKLIAEMTKPEPQAALTKYVPYGPLNLKAYDTGIIPPEIADVLPTNKKFSDKLLVINGAFWAENNDKMVQMYEEMVTE